MAKLIKTNLGSYVNQEFITAIQPITMGMMKGHDSSWIRLREFYSETDLKNNFGIFWDRMKTMPVWASDGSKPESKILLYMITTTAMGGRGFTSGCQEILIYPNEISKFIEE